MIARRLLLALCLTFVACDDGPTPETPPDVAAVPDDAETTMSGLAYRVLTAGTGTEHPTATF